jgi:hypothetical protein
MIISFKLIFNLSVNTTTFFNQVYLSRVPGLANLKFFYLGNFVSIASLTKR